MSRGRLATALGILGVVFVFHLLLVPKVADVDAFYHIGHAARYLASGPFDTSFPWTAFSVVGTEGADLWWGFHLLLAPFAWFGDVSAQIAAAAFVLALMLVGTVLWIARRHRLVGSYVWPVLFFVAVPNVLFRYLMVRPETVSLLLALVLTCLLARGRPWVVALASAGVAFVHLSMAWLPIAVLSAHFAARGVDRLAAGPAEEASGYSWWLTSCVVIGGVLAGWILRPHALAAAKLAWVQIGLLLTVKAHGGDAPLTFGVGLAPLDGRSLLRMAGPMLIAWLGSIVLGVATLRRRDRLRAAPGSERRLLWSAHILALAFLMLTVLVARRALVQWEAFAVLALALSLTHLTPGVERRRITVALLLAVLGLLPWTVHRHLLNVRYVATEPDHLAEVAEWLRDHSDRGDLVFNTHWDQFGPLFARDRVNRYVGGMDPIFQYAYDPTLYWRFHYISTDAMTERTCGTWPCTPEATVDTWSTLVRDFGARFVVVEPRRNPRLSVYLMDDARYGLALETQHEAVFRVFRGSPGS